MGQRLSHGFKFRFSLAELGFTTLRAAADFFLLFYFTDIVAISPAIAASALLFGKLTWDAINDPLVGYLSDRTKSRFGRRRIWMLAAAVPIALATWLQFSLPVGLTGAAAFLAVLMTFWLKDTFVTMAAVAYNALVPEVTHDYQERSSVAAYRGAAAVAGYLLGAAGMTAVVGVFRGLGLSRAAAWSGTGGLWGLIMLVALLVTIFSVRETPGLADAAAKTRWLGSMKLCFKNRPFVILLGVFMLSNFAFTTQAALLPYLIQYQLGMATQISAILAVSLITTGIFLVPARLLADRINKGPAYALGLSIAALGFVSAYLFLPYRPTPWVYLVAFVLGVGFSAHWVMPYAMMPDVMEYDERKTGQRREGVYYGISNFMVKFAIALGTAVPGWALSAFGYVPNAVQTPAALFGIRFFYALVPAAVMLICVPILIRYPITKKSHAALMAELDDRKAASDLPTTEPANEQPIEPAAA
jgi:glycoside/pentoside/hexuronide:cation symporter, GPH family